MKSKTKIVCTIGPASWDQEVMRQMIENGMSVARVNGAFADTHELDKVKELVRNVSDEVSLMVDVKGPEVRMNKFPGPIALKVGDTFVIGNTTQDAVYPANYKDLYKFVKAGQKIVVGDGDVELIVEKVIDDQMYCTVTYGEMIKPGKALNLPGCDYTTEILTAKDRENLVHSLKTGWEFVSASFIQDGASARYIKDFIDQEYKKLVASGEIAKVDIRPTAPMKIIAKIENQDGVDNIDEILDIVDGVMVARGGLGVELGLEKVHAVQKLLIDKCNDLGKQVITATQMLESMIMNPRPTRAEVNDVATAIYQGTDAIMLSAESSAGKYPVGAIVMMQTIAKETESNIDGDVNESIIPYAVTADALTKAIASVCNSHDEIKSVILVSKSGTTARLLSRHRIKQDIFVFTSDEFYRNTLLMSKGITKALLFEGIERSSDNFSRDNAVDIIIEQAKKAGIVEKGQKVLFVGKTPMKSEEYFPNIFEIIDIE